MDELHVRPAFGNIVLVLSAHIGCRPLNSIGMPYYDAPLLSAWSPPVIIAPYYPPPARIPPQVLASMKMNDNIAYAPLPKELRGRRNLVPTGPKKDTARFRSGKPRKEACRLFNSQTLFVDRSTDWRPTDQRAERDTASVSARRDRIFQVWCRRL